jgi:hypothetical protein
MSTINTNTIDANYPIPGQNNSSQGFRDNFASIKQNLDIASNELTDLQNKVVLKSALANSTLNNDMANTLIIWYCSCQCLSCRCSLWQRSSKHYFKFWKLGPCRHITNYRSSIRFCKC